jgi:hypothetical protein
MQPSSQPTRQPTSRPSRQPTSQPTMQPSRQPTSQPTRQPTRQPSMQPSCQPTSQPTNPTSQPTMQPSRQPSSQPSRQPTSQPSMQPSRQPSSQPSRQPSSQPSRQPSGQPSSKPSGQPSVQPSRQPSGQPSTVPSSQPSTQPSSNPTNPTGQPSSLPTMQPSTQPTCNPTNPTGQPSTQPSMQPSSQPSSQPTNPTGQPTSKPSIPTGQPSTQPTTVPTTVPTQQPTSNPSGNKLDPPKLHDTDSYNRTFQCHPQHVLSVISPTEPIFPTASVNGSLVMQRAHLTISPFDPDIDTLLMTGNGFERNLLPQFNRTTGIFELLHKGGDKVVLNTKFDTVNTNLFWSALLRTLSYKLSPENGPPNPCIFYEKNHFTRTFTLQVFDAQDRATAIIKRRFVLKTALFMYTDAVPVFISDVGSPKSVILSKAGFITPFTNEPDNFNVTIVGTS